MIIVAGSANRSFTFPADLPTAFAYYTDLSRILTYLPHIYVARTYDDNQLRMCYNTIELGTYKINIFCDLRAEMDAEKRALRVLPLKGVTPVKAKATLRSATASGRFSSESRFFDEGERTRIEYRLELQAELPRPMGLRFVPQSVINGIAASITHRRIKEIADGFIRRSIDVFPEWLEELSDSKMKLTG